MHSVIDRSPDELLEEIILVDDCSDRGLNVQSSLELILPVQCFRASSEAS